MCVLHRYCIFAVHLIGTLLVHWFIKLLVRMDDYVLLPSSRDLYVTWMAVLVYCVDEFIMRFRLLWLGEGCPLWNLFSIDICIYYYTCYRFVCTDSLIWVSFVREYVSYYFQNSDKRWCSLVVHFFLPCIYMCIHFSFHS